MQLSMSMLAEYLKHYHLEYHIPEDARSIRGIRFFTDQVLAYSLEYVYIGSAAGYFQDPRLASALILANGQNHILCRSADSEELLNDVLSAFDYYNGIEQRLYSAAVRHRPLDEMLSVIGEILPGAFLVFSLDGTLLAHIHLDRLTDPVLRSSILQSQNMQSFILGETMVDKDGNVSHDLTDIPLHLHRRGNNDHGAVSMYLKQEHETLGFIMYFPGSALDVTLGLSLETFFARYLIDSDAFAAPDSAHQSIHTILIQLLDGKEVPLILKKKLAQQVSSDEDNSACLIVFRTLAIQNHTLRSMLVSEIEQSPIPCISCEYGERVVILIRKDRTEKMLQIIQQKMPKDNLSIGVSLPVLDLGGLRAAFRQADFALRADDAPGVRRCREHALSYLTSVLQNDELAQMLLHPAIAMLRSYDRRQRTELYGTLRCYLRTGCSQAETAQALHVHLNTLKYRLRRIREITGICWENREELLYLQISMQIAGEKCN